MRRANWWVGVSLGVALGLGAVVGVEAATDEASAQSGVTVSAGQLKINQRISQAAVRRSNEALDLLDPVRRSGTSDDAPGWGTTQIRDGAVTSAKLDTATREHLPRWAVVAANGSLTRAQGATTSAKLADPGLYTVTFDRDVSACALQATIADGGTTPITTGGQIGVWRSATDAKIVTVRTGDAAGLPTNTLPFTVSVLC